MVEGKEFRELMLQVVRTRCVLHHADALALGPDPGEYVGIVRLGDRQVKVSVELLGRRIVMGVDHSRVRRVVNRVSILHGLRREDHVLVEDRLPDKTTEFPIDLPLIWPRRHWNRSRS